MTSARRREVFDFLVIGDGPVGLLAALKLHQMGKSCALLAPKLAAPTVMNEPDLRVYALAPDCLAQLKASVDWSGVRSKAYQSMRVFEASLAQGIAFDASDYGWDALGEIVEHAMLCQVLTRALLDAGVNWIDGRAQSLEIHEDIALVHGDELSVRARYVVDASGANSTLRAQAAIAVKTHSYAQSAVIANVRLANPVEPPVTAWQRFTEHGTIALLPVFNGSYALVYSALQAKAEQLMQLSEANLLGELQSHFGENVGQLTALSVRLQVPLNRALAEKYVQGPLILLGDSAHVVHPLAGQGLNMGFRDLACLLSVITLSGDVEQMASLLPRFERERKSENAITALAIEGLQRLFLPQAGPIKRLRSFGLQAVQGFAPLKRLFAELAAGKVAW
jgi:ubiquinone biosynthesis UbiH/UbiF/VisC/COQ6 family hydroxylase